MAGMWMRSSAAAVLALATMTAASACAPGGLRLQCAVTGAGKLPPGLGAEDLCAAFTAAIADATGSKVNRVDAVDDQDRGDWARLDIAVRDQYGLIASLRHGHDGAVRTLPELELSSSDRALSLRQVEQLASAVAGQIAQR